MILALGEPPIPPNATDWLSKNKVSPFVYAEPPSVISTDVTALLDTTTFAVAPSQGAVAGTAFVFNNLTLWYVPSVWPDPPFNVLWNLIDWKLCSLSKLITAFVLLFVTDVIPIEPSKFFKNLFVVSLVILFFKSFVTTSPIGNLFA